MSLATLVLAGLGLFFTGLHLLAAAMQPLAGKRMRARLARISAGPVSRALAGILLGAVTQSTTAASFVCLGMLNTGALSFTGVLALIAWSSVGTSVLVYMAAIDVRLTGLYIVGLVGAAHILNAGRNLAARQVVSFLFALGVLLLGLGMVKEASLGLRESEQALGVVGLLAGTSAGALLVGVLAALVTQSASSVTILAATLCVSGVIGLPQSLLAVCGASIGSGFSVVLMTAHLRGRQRQLAVYQCLVKVAGVVVMLPLLLWLAPAGVAAPGVPGAAALGTLIATAYLLLQVCGALLATLFQGPVCLALDRLCPPSREDDLLKPLFVSAEAAGDTETAIVLAAREQDRLLAALPDYLDAVRADAAEAGGGVTLAVRHAAATRLAADIRSFLEDAAVQNRAGVAVEELFAIQGRNESIVSLQEALHGFVSTLGPGGMPAAGCAGAMVEGLHLVLSLLRDALAEGSDDREMLLALTADRSAMMQGVRESLLSDPGTDLAARQSLFVATGIFERIVWLLRQVVVSRWPAPQGVGAGEMAPRPA